jgi:ribosomal peptide maturation radical SAM protein 1
MASQARMMLVSMPWAVIYLPSIQLGTLESVLHGAGIATTSRSYYLDFVEMTVDAAASEGGEGRITVDDHIAISESSWLTGMGDWIFCVPPLRDPSAEDARAYEAHLASQHVDPRMVGVARQMRAAVPAFVERCVADVLAWEPTIVGFTSTFSQNVASLVLAQALKARRPDLTVVFGGANCDDSMGLELMASFPFVDYVVRGEAEYALPALVREIAAGVAQPSAGGVCYRGADGAVVANRAGEAVRMDDVPLPVYEEYFSRLAASRIRGDLNPLVTIPVETARGCWWGAKHHCTFCGLNGSNMTFRSKDARKAADEFATLSARHQYTTFQTVDNILDLSYFKTLLPALAKAREQGDDYRIFYETKANLRKEHVKGLADAGIYWIQPGIESLSSHVLALMDKGSTALQNIRLLKWSREYKLAVSWNMLYGFPGETPEDYEAIHDLIPSLTHLEPPGMFRLLLERFSPYFTAPERYGIDVLGPSAWYRHVYDLPTESLMRLAYDFEYAVPALAGRSYPDLQKRLQTMWPKGSGGGTFRFARGPGFIKLRDRRVGTPSRDVTLRGAAAAVYLAADAGATLAELVDRARRVDPDVASAEIEELLLDLVARRYMYEEGGKYLALAVADRPVLAYDHAASAHLLRAPVAVAT